MVLHGRVLDLGERPIKRQGIPQNDGVLNHGESPEYLFLVLERLFPDKITEGQHFSGKLVPVLAA